VPLVGSPRAAVYAVAAIGFVMCSVHGIGAGMRYTGGSWASPFLIGGAVLGSLALLIVVAAATGLRVPMLAGDREMLLALAGIVGMKFVLTAAHTVTYALAR
jgi:hypothetical protein